MGPCHLALPFLAEGHLRRTKVMGGDPGGYVWGDRAGQGPHGPWASSNPLLLGQWRVEGYVSVLGGDF